MDFDLGSPTTPFQDSPLAEAHHEEANDTNHGSGDHEAPVIQHNTTNPMNNNNNNSPSKFKVQLVPGADGDRASSYQETVTRDLSEGSPIKIGRFVAKDTPSGVRDSDSDRHIWFPSKVISRAHAEMWVRDGQVYVKDIGSSSGTFLNRMRLSPPGKVSRPYLLKPGDLLQFGMDFKGAIEDSEAVHLYRAVIVQVSLVQDMVQQQKNRGQNPIRKFRAALLQLLNLANPYSSSSTATTAAAPSSSSSSSTECCICLCSIGPFQALFLSPCSHVFHYKCARVLLNKSIMFQCPLCRQVANLAASVSMESLVDETEEKEVVKVQVDEDEANIIVEAVLDTNRENQEEANEQHSNARHVGDEENPASVVEAEQEQTNTEHGDQELSRRRSRAPSASSSRHQHHRRRSNQGDQGEHQQQRSRKTSAVANNDAAPTQAPENDRVNVVMNQLSQMLFGGPEPNWTPKAPTTAEQQQSLQRGNSSAASEETSSTNQQ